MSNIEEVRGTVELIRGVKGAVGYAGTLSERNRTRLGELASQKRAPIEDVYHLNEVVRRLFARRQASEKK